jgi:CDP-diacylglycerol---glycerol-3-phosphate 3-phosphatidyltransferase
MAWPNLPNTLTFARLFLVPPLVFSIAEGSDIAAIFLAIATVMDVLDGVIARARGQVTDLGQIVDPIVDKIVISSALIALVVVNRVPGWVLGAIVARDVAVTGLRVLAGKEGIVIPASRFGKRKMDLQLAAVFAAVLASDPSAWYVQVLLYVAVTATFGSGVDYFARFGLLRRGSARSRAFTRAL